MSVTWSETAAAQLQAIRDGLARTSTGYAQALAARIVERAEFLGTMPLFGAEVPEYGDETVRETFIQPYRLIYRVRDNDVHVVALIHSSRRLPRTPPA